MDRLGKRHDLGALFRPAHGAEHDVDAARFHRSDGAGPFHQRRLELESQLVGDLLHDLAVIADHLAVLPTGTRHVASEGDGQLALLDQFESLRQGRECQEAPACQQRTHRQPSRKRKCHLFDP